MTVDHPLSTAQEALWLFHKIAPTSTVHHGLSSFRTHQRLDAVLVERALHETAARHSMMRSTFGEGGDGTVRRVHDDRFPAFTVRDARGIDDDGLREIAEELGRRPFDLANEVPFRLFLFDVADDNSVLLLTAHHIATDATSQVLALNDILHFYAALSRGQEPALPPVRGSFEDFVAEERRKFAGPEWSAAAEYWRSLCLPLPRDAELPLDRPRQRRPNYRSENCEFPLPDELRDHVVRDARARRVTLFVYLFGMLQVMLYRQLQQEDFMIGYSTSLRTRPDLRYVVGYLANTIPYRAGLRPGMTFDDVIQAVQLQVTRSLAHADYPFALLPRLLGADRANNRSPLFQIIFTCFSGRYLGLVDMAENPGRAAAEIAGIPVSGFPVSRPLGNYDLVIDVVQTKKTLKIVFKYPRELFDRSTIERLGQDYVELLAATEKGLDQCVS